jgi:hypothetical protein
MSGRARNQTLYVEDEWQGEEPPLFGKRYVKRHHARFERTGSIDDLDRAATMNKQVVASTPNDHPNHAMYLNLSGSQEADAWRTHFRSQEYFIQ